MKRLINKERLLVMSSILILPILIYWMWFFNFDILTSGDWGFFFKESQLTFLSLPYIWIGNSFGAVFISASSYPSLLFAGILSFIDNFSISERLVYFWPSIIFSSIGSYILIKKILNNKLAAIIGFFVFSFNTYFIIGRGSHLTLMVAFSLAPLIVYFFVRALEEKRIKLAIITGLTSLICSAYEFRAFYIIAFVLFFYFIYYSFFIDRLSFRNFFKNSKFALFPIILVFLINFYWIFGLSQVGAITSNIIFNRSLFGNSFMNILRSITLFHPFWNGSKIEAFVVQPIPLYFWLIPIFAFLGLVLNRKNKNVLFFGFVALVGIFLAKQVAEPFSDVYFWLFKNFPGFNAFRESSKFYFLIALGYSVLIGSFIDWLWCNWNKNQWQNIAKYGLTFLIAGLFLWNVKPVVTGEIGRLSVPKIIPNDYLILKDFILKQSEYFRTFWTPSSSRWGIYTNQNPRISNVGIIETEWKNYVSLQPDYKDWPNKITEVYKVLEANELFDNSSIKYVIIPLQDTANDDDFFISYGGEDNPNIRSWYISELDKISWLKKINIGTSELVVYENANYKPHIYSDSGLNYYQTDASEFGDFSQNQNLYLNSDIAKNNYLFNELDNIIVPIEPDPDKIVERQLAVDKSTDPAEKKKLQNDLDLYTSNLFFKDFKLKIPGLAIYKIYFKSGSVLANNINVSARINNKVLNKGEAGIGREGWDYFNQVELDKGEYGFQLYIGDTPIDYINSGDIVLAAESLNKPIKTPPLEYKQINPTKYIVNVSGASESFPLFFSESFHPGWKIYVEPTLASQGAGQFVSENNQGTIQNENIDGGRFYDLMFRKPVLSDKHFMVNGFANAWWIDLDELERQGKIRSNSDGTYDFSVYIEFEPQKYFYIGLVISGITLVGCLAYLVYDWHRRRKTSLTFSQKIDKN